MCCDYHTWWKFTFGVVNRIGQLDRWECPSLSTKDDRGETKRVSSALCYNGALQQEVDVGSTKV